MHAPSLKGSDALATVALSISLFFLAGPLLASLGDVGIVLMQVLCFALPVLIVAGTRPEGFVAIGIRPCPIRSLVLVAVALIGCTLWYWNALWIGPLSAEWASPAEAEAWSQTLALEARPIWGSLLLFALVPAICEELLHRGIIAPALAQKLGSAAGLLLSSLIFGLFHLSLPRLLPTAVLGFFAGYVRLRSGCLWPAILLHFLYNAALLLAAVNEVPLPEILAIPALVITGVGVLGIHKYSESS